MAVGREILSGLQMQVGAVFRTRRPGRHSSHSDHCWPEGYEHL